MTSKFVIVMLSIITWLLVRSDFPGLLGVACVFFLLGIASSISLALEVASEMDRKKSK